MYIVYMYYAVVLTKRFLSSIIGLMVSGLVIFYELHYVSCFLFHLTSENCPDVLF